MPMQRLSAARSSSGRAEDTVEEASRIRLGYPVHDAGTSHVVLDRQLLVTTTSVGVSLPAEDDVDLGLSSTGLAVVASAADVY
jgi:hypothetical protein